MAGFIGPITLTLGQPYKIALPIETDSVGIDNDSPYDVWLYIGNVAPTDLTNANNTWHRVARRGHTSVLPIRTLKGATSRERSNNAIAAFQGTAFLLAVNPGGVALTGTISGRSQVYVTPYLPGDPPAVHAALSTQTDLSSQPRVVRVPISAAGHWALGHDFAALGEIWSPFPNVLAAAPGPSFVWNGSTSVNVYLHMLACSLGLITGQALFTIIAQEATIGFVVTASHTMHSFEFANGTCYSPHLSTPHRLPITPAVNTAYILLAVQLLTAPAVPARLQFNAMMDTDISSGLNWPGGIGGGLAGSVVGNNVGGAPLF